MGHGYAGKRGSSALSDHDVGHAGAVAAPGKRTLTESLAPVQRRPVAGGEAAPGEAAVRRGRNVMELFGGGGSALPYLDQIQRSFGRHDVSKIVSHVGGEATQAARAMSATAYATGNHVVFAGPPDLHTAAHEAAHVVQQRGGVSLGGGVGEVGDAYERQADAVADRVVRGESAEGLLDAGGAASDRRDPGDAMPRVIQRKIDPDIITDEIYNQCCYRGNSSLEPVLAKINTYNGNKDLRGLYQILDQLAALPPKKATKYSAIIAKLKAEIANEMKKFEGAGLDALEAHHERMPTGINDAKTYNESVNNCSVTSVGALLGRRVSDIVGDDDERQQDFFVNQQFDREGKARPEPNTAPQIPGAYRNMTEEEAIAAQQGGIEDFTVRALEAEGVMLANTPSWSDDLAPDEVKDAMMLYPRGTRYIVKASGHYVYAEHRSGGLVFFDYQQDIAYKRIRYGETEAYADELRQIGDAPWAGFQRNQLAKTAGVIVNDNKKLKKPPGPALYDDPMDVKYRSTAKQGDDEIGKPTESVPRSVSFIAFVVNVAKKPAIRL